MTHSLSINVKLHIRGPVSTRTSHSKDHLARLTTDSDYSYYNHYKRLREGRGNGGQDCPKLIANSKLLAASIKSSDNAELGDIHWLVECPVCMLTMTSHCEGKSLSFLHSGLGYLAKDGKHDAILCCTKKCAGLLEMSPLSYEENYL